MIGEMVTEFLPDHFQFISIGQKSRRSRLLSNGAPAFFSNGPGIPRERAAPGHARQSQGADGEQQGVMETIRPMRLRALHSPPTVDRIVIRVR
jgi:hypothetical protein